jgi:hypothetical protein
LYLRRGGRTGRSGCVISSILTLLWSLTTRVYHSEGVLMGKTIASNIEDRNHQ